MSKFSEAFGEPMYDYFADTGFALDGSYSKEKAVELFKEAAEEYETSFDPDCMGIWHTRFHGGWTDDGEFINGWWWYPYKTGNKGEKEIWVANA